MPPIHPAFVQCDIACVLYRVSLFADFNPAIIYYYFMERGIRRGVDHYYRKSSMRVTKQGLRRMSFVYLFLHYTTLLSPTRVNLSLILLMGVVIIK